MGSDGLFSTSLSEVLLEGCQRKSVLIERLLVDLVEIVALVEHRVALEIRETLLELNGVNPGSGDTWIHPRPGSKDCSRLISWLCG
jgi:hypothetical protein